MRKIINKIKFEIKFILSKLSLLNKKIKVSIMTVDDTLNYIAKEKVSIIRFGDGEFSIMSGRNICPFQDNSDELKKRLIETIKYISDKKVLICLPETLSSIKKFRTKTQKHWTITIANNFSTYKDNIDENFIYGNAFISRPYMIYKDKNDCEKTFQLLKNLFTDQDIVLIEGTFSRSGVGNDLFSKAKSIERIICPPSNAWDKYTLILEEAKKLDKKKLILTSIGPASKPLALDLINLGYRVLDVGHLDSEYEWFLKKANNKESIQGKHTAELSDENIAECDDKNYNDSIICKIN